VHTASGTAVGSAAARRAQQLTARRSPLKTTARGVAPRRITYDGGGGGEVRKVNLAVNGQVRQLARTEPGEYFAIVKWDWIKDNVAIKLKMRVIANEQSVHYEDVVAKAKVRFRNRRSSTAVIAKKMINPGRIDDGKEPLGEDMMAHLDQMFCEY
jgi:hypothetical protein